MIQVKMKIDENVEPHWVINHVAGRYGIPEMAMRYIVNATMSNEHIGHVLLNRKYAKTGIMVVDYVGITVIEGTGTWVKERKTVETGKRLKRLKRLSVFLSFCEAQRCERGIYCKYILILLYIIYKVRVVWLAGRWCVRHIGKMKKTFKTFETTGGGERVLNASNVF